MNAQHCVLCCKQLLNSTMLEFVSICLYVLSINVVVVVLVVVVVALGTD